MARIEWDRIQDRQYETGIDRGVIYPEGWNAHGVAWNGLISVTETGGVELKEYNYEGLKALVRSVPGAYRGKIEAFTYPDLMDELTGLGVWLPGVRAHDGRHKPFHLSYRTKIGDAGNPEVGYKIHIIWNLIAVPSDVTAKTMGQNVDPNVFSWDVKGMQKFLEVGNIPLDHISIDSRETDPAHLQAIENKLYGTADTPPRVEDPWSYIFE